MAKCAECSARFEPKALKQLFCRNACRTAYHNRMAQRGKRLTPLMMAWRGLRSDPVAKQAYVLGCRLIAEFNAEDKTAGRLSAGAFVKSQQLEGHGVWG